jgi:hypothetical protein
VRVTTDRRLDVAFGMDQPLPRLGSGIFSSYPVPYSAGVAVAWRLTMPRFLAIITALYGQQAFGLEPKSKRKRGIEMEIKGGCLCGAVRYTAEADPTSATVCHCRDCQKFTGSAFAALVRVPKEALTIEGTLKTFTSIGGSGNPILRHFCPECGSSIAEDRQCGPIALF